MSTADKGDDDLELFVPNEYSGLVLPPRPKLLLLEEKSSKLVSNSRVNVESLLICSSQRRSSSGDVGTTSSKDLAWFGKICIFYPQYMYMLPCIMKKPGSCTVELIHYDVADVSQLTGIFLPSHGRVTGGPGQGKGHRHTVVSLVLIAETWPCLQFALSSFICVEIAIRN